MKIKKVYSTPLLIVSLVAATNIGLNIPTVFTRPLIDKTTNQASMPNRCPIVIMNPYIQRECHGFYEYSHLAGNSLVNSEHMDKFTKLAKSYNIIDHFTPKTRDSQIIKAHRKLSKEFYSKQANYVSKFPNMANTDIRDAFKQDNQSLLMSMNFSTALSWVLLVWLIAPAIKLPFRSPRKCIEKNSD
ncbi:TPA: hypothetical protein I7730_16290 [Vibrio vulnificus]|uniref:Uncharacterized protein n=1 Tax=Vibrio vulnificus TaxID=672 RepID=A0A8H9TGB0_VIBVL|nr:hypothetical protein [Vibrio vulnificus]